MVNTGGTKSVHTQAQVTHSITVICVLTKWSDFFLKENIVTLARVTKKLINLPDKIVSVAFSNSSTAFNYNY